MQENKDKLQDCYLPHQYELINLLYDDAED